jgi:hypothetical protein
MKRVITPASNLAISLEDAKEFLRVEFDYEDDLVTQMIKSATKSAENFIGYQITTCTYEDVLPSFTNTIKLYGDSVVNSIKYYDENNTLQTLNPSFYRVVNVTPNFIEFDTTFSTPSLYNRSDAVIVNYTCGMENINIPTDIISWIKIRIATLYESRNEFEVGYSQMSRLDTKYLESFLYPYKVFP